VSGDGRWVHAQVLGQCPDRQAVLVAEGPEQAHLGDRQSVLGPALYAQPVDDADGIAIRDGDFDELLKTVRLDAHFVGFDVEVNGLLLHAVPSPAENICPLQNESPSV
jgi:hypothetical protein